MRGNPNPSLAETWPTIEGIIERTFDGCPARRIEPLRRLQQRDCALTAVRADADDAALSGRALRNLLYRLAQYPRAGRAERMSERDAAAVRIHTLARERSEVRIDAGLVADKGRIFERLDVEQHLSRECFVNLPEIDVAVREAAAREEAWNRKRRRHQQSFGPKIHRRNFPVDQLGGEGTRRQLREAGFGCDPQARGTIGQRRRVARGQRAPAAGPIERRGERRELFRRRVLAGERVALQSTKRNDEIIEESTLPRSDRALVAFERNPVLLFAPDVPLFRRDLRVLAHAHAGRAIGDGRDVELDIGDLQIGQPLDLLSQRSRLLEPAKQNRTRT